MISRLTTLGIGALAMYFFDPVSGARRRALLRERMEHYRGRDLVAEAKRVLTKGARGTSARGSSKVDIDRSQPH